MKAIAQETDFEWNPKAVVVGTTPWVTNDPSGGTIALAQEIGDVALMTSELSFAQSIYPELQAYEQGFVKEGVGAGGSAIAAYLHQNWSNREILAAVEESFRKQQRARPMRQTVYDFAIAS